jgi:hypothetical protein
MFSFVQSEVLPEAFRANANMASHRFDCMHGIGPGNYCRVCRVYRMSQPSEIPFVFFLDKPVRLPNGSVGNSQEETAKHLIPYALEFMKTPHRGHFQITAIYGDWNGWLDEEEVTRHAIAASKIVESLPADSEPLSEEDFLDEWVNVGLRELIGPLMDFEGSFEVNGDRFEILSVIVGHDAAEFGRIF